MRFEVLAAILVAAGILYWVYRRDRRRFEAERAMLFDDLRGLLAESELSRTPMSYPVLRGRYRGHRVVIDAVLDNLSVRKVPSLWLRVTLLADIPFAGSCDILARAHNVEFYAPSNSFDHALPLPADWPQHLTIKCDVPDAVPPQSLLQAHIGLFEDERVKELLVTPKGVRLVRQAAQASRAEYLVLRQSLFGPVVVPRGGVQDLLDRALALADTLRSHNAAEAAS
ncbi:hypothetical protein [Dongia sp.]|uniref:hypothetical protein n=1 Tax=Dongia sp. TaxID=1977262 RepID=UPI0035AFEDBB